MAHFLEGPVGEPTDEQVAMYKGAYQQGAMDALIAASQTLEHKAHELGKPKEERQFLLLAAQLVREMAGETAQIGETLQ